VLNIINNVFQLDQTNRIRVSLWIGHCYLCTEGHLHLRLQSV